MQWPLLQTRSGPVCSVADFFSLLRLRLRCGQASQHELSCSSAKAQKPTQDLQTLFQLAALMDAQLFRWIREATDEQLQQLLSTVNVEIQTRQALRANTERDLTDAMINQWRRCPIRCHQPCDQCGQQCCVVSSHPNDFKTHASTGQHRCSDHWGDVTTWVFVDPASSSHQ